MKITVTKEELDSMTYYERFELIREVAASIICTTTDARVAGCASDIRVACNRYEREAAPRRGD